ncbi:hypothetical protein EVAR_26551_1 [Eumeta japonica]|uniref:Uncharacterized protein n=1 Tax=Eumeta variegata TaxID=151549 RepID=A0A4C1W3L6_EUMVA|nr:hypothetical protein EVAR_26551_1 [Eumeta japonica]
MLYLYNYIIHYECEHGLTTWLLSTYREAIRRPPVMFCSGRININASYPAGRRRGGDNFTVDRLFRLRYGDLRRDVSFRVRFRKQILYHNKDIILMRNATEPKAATESRLQNSLPPGRHTLNCFRCFLSRFCFRYRSKSVGRCIIYERTARETTE